MTDSNFLSKFADGTLPPEEFSHHAHLRLAWLHIDRYGVEVAVINVTNQIKNYVRLLGAEDKYNETLTVAAIKTVNHFYLKSNGSTFNDMITEYPRVVNNFKRLIDAHYGFDIFNSDEAKERFLEPDLLPYD